MNLVRLLGSLVNQTASNTHGFFTDIGGLEREY